MALSVTYDNLSDQQLAELLRDGDNIAYTEIYNRYHGPLYVHVFNKIRNREEAKDLVHDLFIKLWQNHAVLELKTTLAAYLYTAARYKVFDWISNQQVVHKYHQSIGDFVEKDEYVTDHLVREKDLLLLIEKEIAALPQKMREIFELSRKENLSHRQIADQLGLSDKTVKKQVNNALKILRVKLGSNIFIAFIL